MTTPIFHDAPELGAYGVSLRAVIEDRLGPPPRVTPFVVVEVWEGSQRRLVEFPAFYLRPLHDLLGKLIAAEDGAAAPKPARAPHWCRAVVRWGNAIGECGEPALRQVTFDSGAVLYFCPEHATPDAEDIPEGATP